MLVKLSKRPQQRLVDQVAVPRDTNEEAAGGRPFGPEMDFFGRGVLCDRPMPLHTIKANCRQLTQGNGARVLFLFLKANQPLALGQSRATAARHPSPLRPATLDKRPRTN